MDWTVCPSCGLRYLPTELWCPGCGARRNPKALLAKQGAAQPRRDLILFAFHLAMGGSIVWTVVEFGRPLWALAVAALELAIAAGALARWRLEDLLVNTRAVLYGGAAAMLLSTGIGSPLLFPVILAHAFAVWTVRRTSAAPILSGAFSGLGDPASAEVRVAQARASAELRYWAPVMALVPAALSWLALLSVLRGLAAGRLSYP